MELLKSNVRAYMYKGRFTNKETFWEDVLQKRKIREDRKLKFNRYTKIEQRYRSYISTTNFNKIRDIILKAVGTPSFIDCKYYAGDPKKSNYTGSYYGKRYSSRCTYSKVYHTFNIYASRELEIQKEFIGGLYNIRCYYIAQWEDIEVYSATWIKKKRGFDFEFITGFIAVSGENSNHAESIEKAITGLERKIKTFATAK